MWRKGPGEEPTEDRVSSILRTVARRRRLWGEQGSAGENADKRKPEGGKKGVSKVFFGKR